MINIKLRELLKHKTFLPTIIVIISIVFLICLPNKYENDVYKFYERNKAIELSVDNSLVRQSGLITNGDQSCEVEILNGPYKGEKAWASNMLMGDHWRMISFLKLVILL